MIKANNDFKYDLMIGQQAENLLGSIISDSKLEVKFDKYNNDRFFIEIACKRWDTNTGDYILNHTGLSVTHSEYYVLVKENLIQIIKTIDLKNLIREKASNANKSVYELGIFGGDGKRTLGVMVTMEEVVKYAAKNRVYKESILD